MLKAVRVAGLAAVGVLSIAAGSPPEMLQATGQAIAPALAAFASPPIAPAATAADFEQPSAAGDDSVTDRGVKPNARMRTLVAEAENGGEHALDADGQCLAAAVYYESRGEPLEGQLAVAQVILNRVDSGRFAASICGVVRQPGQFGFVQNGTYAAPRAGEDWRVAQAVALIALDAQTRSMVGPALHFHAAKVAPGWRLTKVAAIGSHVFYR